MLFLVGAILCSTLVIHTFRFAQGRADVDRLLFANYVVAAATGWVQVASGASVVVDPGLVVLALVTGALFIGNFYLLDHAVRRLGPSLAGAASRLSAVIPVVLSVLVFQEVPGWAGWAGIALAVGALPLTFTRSPGDARADQWRAALPALLVFVGFGVNDFTLKIQSGLFPAATKPLFLALVYSTALGLSAIRLATRRDRTAVPPWTWPTGLVLGLANYGSALFFTWALGEMDGSRAYALNSVGVIAAVSLTSLLLWRERPTKRLVAFLVLAAVSVALLQAGRG